MTRQGNRKTARRASSVTRRRGLQSGAAMAALPAGAQPVGPVMAALSHYMSAARERYDHHGCRESISANKMRHGCVPRLNQA